MFLFFNHSVFLKKRKDGRIKQEIRPMKKHSFLSYMFWTTAAVLAGIMLTSATAKAAKTARRYIASAGTTFIYEAAPLPYSVVDHFVHPWPDTLAARFRHRSYHRHHHVFHAFSLGR